MLCKNCKNKMATLDTRQAQKLDTNTLAVVRTKECPSCKTKVVTLEQEIDPKVLVTIKEITVASAARKLEKSLTGINKKRTVKLRKTVNIMDDLSTL